MIDLDEVRKEIAIKYGFVPDKDDPAFIPVMAFDTILEKAVADLNAHQEANLKALLNALQRGNTEAKITGGMVITDATNHVSSQVKEAVVAAFGVAEVELWKDLNKVLFEIRDARNATFYAAGICVASLLIGIGVKVFF